MGTSFTIQAVAHLSPKSFSETVTDTSNKLSISSLLRACTPVNSSTLAPKQPSPSATFSQLMPCQKGPSSLMSKLKWETVAVSPEHLEPVPSLLDTLRMAGRPVSECHLV